MYRRLEAELVFHGMTKQELSEKTGIRYNTLVLKLSGGAPLQFSEAVAIKKAIGSKYTLEELFECE